MHLTRLSGTARIVIFVAPLALAAMACAIPATVGDVLSTVQATQPATEQVATQAVAPPPSETPAPTETVAPTDTPEPSETPTITPTQGPNFGAASVYAVSHLSNDKLLVTIQVPGGVEGEYKAYVSNLPFACEILDKYPDRLYCNGPEPYGLYAPKDATVEILTMADSTTVFTAQFTVPAIPTPTLTPTPKPTATP
jgi:hypothetical protein